MFLTVNSFPRKDKKQVVQRCVDQEAFAYLKEIERLQKTLDALNRVEALEARNEDKK